MTRSYGSTICPKCGRDVSHAGGGYRRHFATHDPRRLDDRLRQVLAWMVDKRRTFLTRTSWPSDEPEIIHEGGFRLTLADARRMETAGCVRVERIWRSRACDFVAVLTHDGRVIGHIANEMRRRS